jgi:hypothetical protein
MNPSYTFVVAVSHCSLSPILSIFFNKLWITLCTCV